MEPCIYCGAATQLYVRNAPVCIACDEKRSNLEPRKSFKAHPALIRSGRKRVNLAGVAWH
jgi:hypothetical protein